MADMEKLREWVAKLELPWDESCLSGAIRHLDRNVDHDWYCGKKEEHNGPSRYDGPMIAALVNAAPELLQPAPTPEAVERVARAIQEADDPVYRWAELARYIPLARAALAALRRQP